jgi:hypothetical protein
LSDENDQIVEEWIEWQVTDPDGKKRSFSTDKDGNLHWEHVRWREVDEDGRKVNWIQWLDANGKVTSSSFGYEKTTGEKLMAILYSIPVLLAMISPAFLTPLISVFLPKSYLLFAIPGNIFLWASIIIYAATRRWSGGANWFAIYSFIWGLISTILVILTVAFRLS